MVNPHTDFNTKVCVLFSEAWVCPSADLLPDTMSPVTPEAPDTVMCTIQVSMLLSAYVIEHIHILCISLCRHAIYRLLSVFSWRNIKREFFIHVFTHKFCFVLMQLTAANGALCFINPLYLQEHGDDWLTHSPGSTNLINRPFTSKRDRRLSTARPWPGAGLKKRTESVEESPVVMDSSGNTKCF